MPCTPKAISYFTNSKKYIKTEITKTVFRRIIGNGALASDGNEHKRQRKLLTPAFATEHIKNLVPAFWSKTIELKNVLEDEIDKIDYDKGYDILKTLTRATLDIIALAGIS
jgi:cytochrome P450